MLTLVRNTLADRGVMYDGERDSSRGQFKEAYKRHSIEATGNCTLQDSTHNLSVTPDTTSVTHKYDTDEWQPMQAGHDYADVPSIAVTSPYTSMYCTALHRGICCPNGRQANNNMSRGRRRDLLSMLHTNTSPLSGHQSKRGSRGRESAKAVVKTSSRISNLMENNYSSLSPLPLPPSLSLSISLSLSLLILHIYLSANRLSDVAHTFC